ncbi:hypothetical protein PRK78_006760 [Emydomyces testavorans]|uniref:Uncharacterized protein n=1 Tax=Emydomyces testavorans TaxID=2070801 RepID=A0AAF0IKU0_9EURO|nr:hypothetical protein PRK78_006760 [Emydomyces testavorans]
MVRLVLEREANVLETDSYGWAPLHYAAWRGNTSIIRMLVDAGADISLAAKPANKTPLALVIKEGHYAATQLLVELGACISPSSESSPLFVAAKHNRADILRFLIKAGAAIACGYDDNPLEKAFTIAVTERCPEALRALLEAGARGRTVSIRRSALSNLSMLRALIDFGADIRGMGSDGTSIFHKFCLDNEYIPQAKLVLEMAPDLAILADNTGRTPLDSGYLARPRRSNEEMAMFLVGVGGAKRAGKALDRGGNNALHLAVLKAHVGVVKALLEANPSLALSRNCHNRTALHYAARVSCVSILHRDKDGCTSTHDRDVSCAESDGISMINDLLDAGADLNARTNNGSSALHWAIGHGKPGIARKLIDIGIDVGITNNAGETALCCAILKRQVNVVERLCQTGCGVKERTRYGITPLHVAVFSEVSIYNSEGRKRMEIVNLLVAAGAYRFARDSMGRTPNDLYQWPWRDKLRYTQEMNYPQIKDLYRGLNKLAYLRPTPAAVLEKLEPIYTAFREFWQLVDDESSTRPCLHHRSGTLGLWVQRFLPKRYKHRRKQLARRFSSFCLDGLQKRSRKRFKS